MSGDAVIAVAIWTIFWKHDYISLLATPSYFLISYGLLLSGVLAVTAATWGCCSVWRELRSMLCVVSIAYKSIIRYLKTYKNNNRNLAVNVRMNFSIDSFGFNLYSFYGYFSGSIKIITLNLLFSLQHSLLLVIVFALQFTVGGFAYIYETQIDDELLKTLNKTFLSSYGVDETRTIAIDSMQQKVSRRDDEDK